MVAIPTNYKMGTGLAATIMGQQAGLEAEQTGLQNLYKAMQMPQEVLKGQEAAMLMQDPNYLQQKTQNTFVELQNNYSANQFQQTLNEVGRAKLALQASGGDPKALYPYLEKLGAKPGDPLYQAVDKNPEAVLTKYEQALTQMIANTGGAKQIGAERVAEIRGENAMELAQLRGDIQSKLIGQRAATGGVGDKYKYNRVAIEQRALNGDVDAQRQVNLWAIQRAQSQAGSMQIVQRPDGTWGIGQKGDSVKLPFPDAGVSPQQQPAGTQQQPTNSAIDWAYSVYIGKATKAQVPEQLKSQVNTILEKPPANWTQPQSATSGQPQQRRPLGAFNQ